jgi:hypothetical protein
MSAIRTMMLGLTLCAGLAATSRAAPPAEAIVDPPPPASLEIPDVEAWASAYLHRDAWTLITHDTEGARFTRTEGAAATGPSRVEADVRTELFQPVQMGSGLARSGLAHWSVDCATARYAVLTMTIFTHNNLQGELDRKAFADKAWMTPNESQAATISVICKAILGGKPFERRSAVGAAKPS